MKKIIGLLLASAMIIMAMTACGNSAKGNGGTTDTDLSSKEVVIVSREEGSGTRGAFVELFGIEEKDANGKKVDNTTDDAEITNSTSVMMTTVAGNDAAIGYISLGSLNDTVKALKIDGVEATTENIKNGTYKIARPFNIATKGNVSAAAQDFIDFIMSKDGQAVVEENGYISVSDAAAYAGTKPSGKITIAGSSSVTPVMEKLKEAYAKINTNATIEIQESDSTTGMTSAIDGTCDIGMASRELKDSEKEKGLTGMKIAMDGIAVIVNKGNTLSEMKSETVKAIYKGETTSWADILK